MKCVHASYYSRVLDAGIYREIFACNRIVTQNSCFPQSARISLKKKKKKNHACASADPASVNNVAGLFAKYQASTYTRANHGAAGDRFETR